MKKGFLITIDAEEDNGWSKNKKITTKNAKYLFRFQKLCEKYNFKPTYLANHAMAHSKVFQSFGRDIIKNNTGEIGLHIHAWDSPPIYNLTENDSNNFPYLIEYPKNIMREKVMHMKKLLEKTFKVKIVSHRAGRWAFNEEYAKILIEHNVLIDCSVTPLISWERTKGDPKQKGGSDYTNFPNKSYFVNSDNIKEQGDSKLLEVPMTTIKNNNPLAIIANMAPEFIRKISIVDRVLTHFFPTAYWFRPGKNNLKTMIKILNKSKNNDYLMFMLHSSEFMPGCNPVFKTNQDIEKLYENLEILFKEISKYFVGMTMKEYYNLKNGKY